MDWQRFEATTDGPFLANLGSALNLAYRRNTFARELFVDPTSLGNMRQDDFLVCVPPLQADEIVAILFTIHALSTIDLRALHIGRDVILLFPEGNDSRPVIVGCIRESAKENRSRRERPSPTDQDISRSVINADEKLVLECGKASITLTADGRVLIRGAFISSRSTGDNRIIGTTIHMN